MEKFDLCVPQKYMSQGVEKTFWANVGTMTVFTKEGKTSRIVEIPAIGLKANVFARKPKEGVAAPVAKPVAKAVDFPDTIEYPNEDINTDDIPF